MSNAAFGEGSCAVGHRALAMGTDGIGLKCECGLELQGRGAPGQAVDEAVALYKNHATRCPLALDLDAPHEPPVPGLAQAVNGRPKTKKR